MDHVELTPYPMPADAPRLMPYQDMPFNGDGYVAAEVLRLAKKHMLDVAIETGTCMGTTTIWLAQEFNHVHTIEVDPGYAAMAASRAFDHKNRVLWKVGNSSVLLGASLLTLKNYALIFLDAHWGNVNPLLDELATIADYAGAPRPVIVIHDFQVSGHPELGFDKMPDGRPINIDLVRSSMDRIYGEGKWAHHTNTVAEGAMRGVGYFEPIV